MRMQLSWHKVCCKIGIETVNVLQYCTLAAHWSISPVEAIDFCCVVRTWLARGECNRVMLVTVCCAFVFRC